MLPSLRSGELVFARQQDTYATGDVLPYEVRQAEPGAGVLVIHRVIGGTADDGYVLQGDIARVRIRGARSWRTFGGRWLRACPVRVG